MQTNALSSHSYYLQNIYEISTQFAGYFESIIQCFYETGEQLDFDGTKPSKTIYTNSIDKTGIDGELNKRNIFAHDRRSFEWYLQSCNYKLKTAWNLQQFYGFKVGSI